MGGSESIEAEDRYDFYGPHYRRFGSEIAARIRREVYGEDHGQTGWRTAAEQRRIAELLRLGPAVELLDIACGSGGPSLALAASTGCRVTGLDIEPAGIAHAQAQAEAHGLTGRAQFKVADCGGGLPFADGSFAVVLCMDAISSLPDRAGTVREWARLLPPGGRLLFTDALVLTGAITKPELDLRASQGVHLIVPAGCNEAAIAAAGLTLLRLDDTTAEIATIAQGLHDARARHAEELTREEDATWFDWRQRFLAITAELARSRRLSRFLYLAERPAA
jgi:SAM-dependent methyltransferase